MSDQSDESGLPEGYSSFLDGLANWLKEEDPEWVRRTSKMLSRFYRPREGRSITLPPDPLATIEIVMMNDGLIQVRGW